MMNKEIYLDNGMATRPSQKAISKMVPFLTEKWGNPMSPHKKGQEVYSDLSEAYRPIYSLLGALEEDTFVFTSSGTEAVNHVINSLYFDQTLESGRNHYLTSSIDEAAAIMAIGRLESLSCIGRMIPPDKYGKISVKAVSEAITPRTALLSLSHANGLTGVINPVEAISDLCEERGIVFHLDMTHTLGKLFFDLADIKAHFITFSGDLLHAPRGSGGLLIKGTKKPSSFILGGLEQAGLRAGSYSLANLVALGDACNEMIDARDFVCTETARLRDKLEKGIIEGFKGAKVLFQNEERLPNITTVVFPGIVNEMLLFCLNKRGVFACIGGGNFQQISIILEHCGIEKMDAQCAISFNLSRETTDEEIENAIAIIVEESLKLEKLSLNIKVAK